MEDIERMYRHLVRTIRASFPQYLTAPMEVGELYQTILPYRLHRRELGLETNQDYELVMLELLSGARGFLIVDDRMRDRLSAEQSAPMPNAAIVRDFASAHVALAPEPLHRLESELRGSGQQLAQSPGSAPTPREAAAALRSTGGMPVAGRSSAPTPSAGLPAEPSPRRATKPVVVNAAGEHCPFCKGELPAGRELSFCPHCGQDLTLVHCPACGSELERGWKFCVTCGRTTDNA